MKKLIIYSTLWTLTTTILFFGSCSFSNDIPAECGGDDSNIGIGLETNVLSVSGSKSRSVVKTDIPYDIYQVIATDENGEKRYRNEFYIYDNGKGDFYNKYKETLSFDWFSVSTPDYHTAYYQNLPVSSEVTIDLEENNTGIKRTLIIYLMVIGGADSLTIFQESK